jgi:hypothetical protein
MIHMSTLIELPTAKTKRLGTLIEIIDLHKHNC